MLFAASGAAALIYQVVWFQQLSLAIGSSALSLGVLLATFMGGLCLGSLLASRTAVRSPLRAYAAIELAIGVLGLVALAAIPLLGGAYAALAGGGSLSLGLRLAIAALALLPATMLMGATLPVVAGWLRADAHAAAWLGSCYAANTVGGVLGCIGAGFYLLRVHDARVATLVAVALNVAIAALAGALARRAEARSLAPTHAAAVTAGTRGTLPIYVAAALSGMTALAAEVLWTRHLSLLLGGTVYTFALILAVLLLGLGAGSAAGAALGRRIDPRTALAAAQAALGLLLVAAAYVLARSLPYWPIDVAVPTSAAVALQLDLLRTAYVVLPAALLWGASFPLALAALVRAGEIPRRAVGRLYAVNTAGAIVGALATTFLLVTALGSQRTQQLLVVATAAAAVLLLLTSSTTRRGRRVAAAAATSVALLAAAFAVPPLPPELVAYGRFLPTRGLGANVVYVGEGLTASVAVTEEPNGTLTYHNAGKTQASTYPEDMRLQRMLGHLATLLPARPREVLVIGLGAGITAGAVALDPAVERVVVAELEPLVPKVASRYFAEHNFGVVDSDKVQLRIDDGRHVLATSRRRFDAITSDPLDPWVKGAAALYTREFWELCEQHLNDGGVVTVFVQLYEITEEAVRSELATFVDVFPNAVVFANTVEGVGYDAVLVGRKGDEPIDLTALARRLERPDYAPVASSLRAVGFDSALDLMSTFAASAESLGPWLAGAPRNTDRNLRLQYLAGQGLNVFAAGEIFGRLAGGAAELPPGSFTGTPAELEELRQRVAARQGRY